MEPTPTFAFPHFATAWFEGRDDAASVGRALRSILEGAWTPVQVAAFAVLVRARGETAPILLEAARALRSSMIDVPHGLPTVLDTCGTGGDGAHTLNISTAAALVVAAAGVPVAKHGNRSVSSQCGSADVLEALGIPLDLATENQAKLLHDVGIAFLFAPAHHPALKHAAQARKELGIRTLFNALGPLVNPARATHQVVGVYDDSLRPLMAQALAGLGTTRAWVVRSRDGLDELSPADETRITELDERGHLHERVVSPEDFGLKKEPLASLAGGTAVDNAQALEGILKGNPHPARTAIVLNAAASFCVVQGMGPKESAQKAQTILDSGEAFRLLNRWRTEALALRKGS